MRHQTRNNAGDAAERYVQKPGFGSIAEAAAMGEGFGDYWAASVVAQRSGGFQDVCVNASFNTAANALVTAASNPGFTDAESAAIRTILQNRGFTVTV